MTTTRPAVTNPIVFGAVVRWRSQRTEGYGQVLLASAGDGRVLIRTWLPCPTKEVSVLPGNLTVVATLEQLLAALR